MTQQQINDLKQSLISLINSKLADQSTIIASEHRDVETAIVDAIFTDKSLIGDIKEIACNQQYIIDNFEPISNTLEEGKAFSTSERVGWAICNGKNGTINKMGRVAIGYDPSNYPITTTGGNKDAVVISHTHYIAVSNTQTSTNAGSLYDGTTTNRFEQGLSTRAFDQGSDAFDYELVTVAGTQNSGKTSNASGGVSGTNNNMQPYIVTLFIQKIS
jgi:hypothetical protein